MTLRYIATVTTGRSGQASLARLINESVPNCFAAFEFPDFKPRLPGALGDMERHLRRRFVETHELLGRGKVIDAFDSGDAAYLDSVAAARLKGIAQLCEREEARTFVDVSKYFARGLHEAICRQLPEISLILLLRDPLSNMRSFMNREKNFRLDNSLPSAANNLLRLTDGEHEKGELYLWSWFEMALRYQDLTERFNTHVSLLIRTEELSDRERMQAHFATLGLPVEKVDILPPTNTNADRNLPETVVQEEDRKLLMRFLERVPAALTDRVSRITGYDFTEFRPNTETVQ